MKESKIVLLAGFGRAEKSYRKLIESAPEGTSVMVIPFTELDSQEYILQKVSANGFSPAHIVGHSLGGAIAIRLVAEHPEIVQSLTLVDSAGVPTPLHHLLRRTAQEHIFQEPLPKLGDNIAAMGRILAHPSASLRAIYSVVTMDAEAYAKEVTVPTVILWGAKDRLFPPALAKHLQQLFSHAVMDVYPEGDHEWIQCHPEEFWRRYTKH